MSLRSATLGARALVAALSLCAPAIAEAETGVRLQVDRPVTSVGSALQVTVELTVEGQGYQSYLPPVMQGFRVLANVVTSQNIEMINWRVRRRETRVYTAVPLKEGKLTIGPAAMRVGGRLFRSAKITVTVGKGVAPLPAPTAPGPSQLPQGQKLGQVFIAGSVTPKRAYVGQQVIAAWRLYSTGSIMQYRPQNQPSTDNFWTEEIRSPRQIRFTSQEVVGGRTYDVAPILRKALFPQKAGKLTAGPIKAQVRVFGRFGPQGFDLASQPLQIEVLPLPLANRPPNFPELNVGKYVISATLDRDRVKAGEALQLKVVVNGRGNIGQLKVGKLGQIDGFKVYQPKITDRLRRGERISGEKLIEYLLLPRRGGRLKIPPVVLDFFDPEKGRYQRASTRAFIVHVQGTLSGGGGGGVVDGKKNVLSLDIRPPRAAGKLTHRARFSLLHPLTLGLFFVPLGLFLGMVGLERLRARLSRQTARSLSRAAARRIRARLSEAQRAASRGDLGSLYGALTGAISEQLADRLGAKVEGLTRPELLELMRGAGFDDALGARTIEALDTCDFGRFARSGSGDDLEPAISATRALLRALASARLNQQVER